MQEFISTLKEHIFEAICTGAITAFLCALKYIWKKVKQDIQDIIDKQSQSLKEIQDKCEQESKEQKFMREGLVSVLHDRLYQACTAFISQGYIEIGDLRNLEYLYNGYHNLGGNGTGTELFLSCKSLPLGNPENNTNKEE